MKFPDIKLKHVLLTILFTVVIIFVFIYISDIWQVLGSIGTVLLPVIYGIVIAYILNYPYKLFANHAFKNMGKKHKWLSKVKKPLSMVLAYVIVFGIVTYLIVILVPELSTSIKTLVDNIPSYSERLLQWIDGAVDFIYERFNYNLYDQETYTQLAKLITGSDTTTFIKDIATNVLPQAMNTAIGIGTGLYNWIIGIIISIYLLAGKARLLAQLRRVITAYTPRKFYLRFFKFADICNNKCGKYIIGKIIDSLIIGIICYIGLMIFRFDYALLISVIVGVTNIIPFFGPIIGAIPCTFLLLIIDPKEALFFLIFVIVLQQFDGNILGPKILGETVGMSGFWILVSVIVGGGLFGVVGMALGVPVFAVIYTLIEEGVQVREKRKAAKEKLQQIDDESPDPATITEIPENSVEEVKN